jgi:hypothetical protein
MGAWAQGGDPTVILGVSRKKAAIDAFTGQATRFVDVAKGQAGHRSSALRTCTSRTSVSIRSSCIATCAPASCCVSTRTTGRFVTCAKPQKRKLAKTGDGEKFQIITEWGLVARNWKASSKVVAAA